MISGNELADLTTSALALAVDGDVDGASSAVCRIGERAGRDQFAVYAACCGFAEAGRQALVKLYGGRAPDTTAGQHWGMLHVGSGQADAADTFALRFLIAYANDDRPTALALWRATLTASSEEYVASVASLLATVASLVRSANPEGAGR